MRWSRFRSYEGVSGWVRKEGEEVGRLRCFH
jgi:hypothetical protein